MKNYPFIPVFWLSALAFLLVPACTKLDTEIYDQVADFWETPDQIAAGVAPAYVALRSYPSPIGGVYPLNELSSDEIIVPTRGSDWSDGGVWRDMWKHTWTPSNYLMEDGWRFIYNGVAQVNQILQVLESLESKPKDLAAIVAELKTIRAFYHYLALDLFGNVPIAISNNVELKELTNRPRTEVFTFVEKELLDNLPKLSAEVSPSTYGRATQWFAHAILAKLYLNAVVFTGAPRWAECIAACDAILNSNHYLLETAFFDNFRVANEGSKESIFSIPYDIQNGLDGFWIQGATLHYNSGSTFGLRIGGINGFCTTAEYYALFDANDVRRKMFLVGQQYENQIQDAAHLQYDTEVNLPLFFDPKITTFSNSDPKSRMSGARCAKWEFNKESLGNMSNDFAVFRLADIVMMKAEAQYRTGNSATALATINQKINGVSIRSRAALSDFKQSELNPEGLLAERAREFSWEGLRRNDMIRLGHFNDARIPEKGISESFRTLYPIPKPELDKNPFLKQNLGYPK